MNETQYENAIIEIFRDKLGYSHAYGPDVERDYADPLFRAELQPALKRINPLLPEVAIKEAISKMCDFSSGDPITKNKIFTDYLQNGVSVNYFFGGEQKSTLVYLVDYQNIDMNTFIIANQWSISEHSIKRPDLIVFLNGIPIAVAELKSPSRESTDAGEAYLQLRNYMHEIPSLFIYNAFLVTSDQAHTKTGTITAGEDRFMAWKTTDGSYENTQFAGFDTFFIGIFEKKRLIDLLKNFICYSGDIKILGAYHQYFAVKKAVNMIVKATQTDGKGGVFWHTQGSGKSLSMVFFAKMLQEVLQSPTILVLTDRNDLDNQLYEQFLLCSDYLRQTPKQAESRINLKELLEGRESYGIIFSTMQKFEECLEPLSERRNIIVIADEAHRGQYGLEEKVDADTGRVTLGTARVIRDSLPNATYIGFTGTPISSKDRSTIEVFGNYIDIYDMTQAVEDGATRPVFYESRVIHLKLDEDILKLIDAEYDILAQNAESHAIEKSKKELGKMESILGAEQTISALCNDIVKHYEENRQYEQTGKAMIVAYSRPIGIKIYRKLMEMRPHWAEKIGVVMTSDNNDPEDWHDIIGNKNRRDELAKKFKSNDDSMKIAIVVDMWLTGFDVPSLATMYIYKPMAGHNLMQAIARVNRVYKDKVGGLVVDYVGIAPALKQAMSDYTNRDKRNYGDTDIAKTALPKFIEKLEVCRSLMHGYNYTAFMSENATDLARAKAISGGVNFLSAVKSSNIYSIEPGTILHSTEPGLSMAADAAIVNFADYVNDRTDVQNLKDAFIKEAMLLRQALSLCRSLLDQKQRYEAAYFDAVRTLLTRISGSDKKFSLKDINEHINGLLKGAIQSKGVINLFSDIDIEFSLFDPKFLDEIAKMEERNLAVEILKKLLAEQVSIYRKTNLVKSEKFSERLARAMREYINGMLTNEEVIAELMEMAEEMATAQAEGSSLGLSDEELAFYDALTRPAAVKDFYQNEELIDMTRELTDQLRKSRTIDWQKKEAARAGMRRMVKRLLKKYKYPPEGVEYALETVIGQCEMWVDN